MTRLYCPVTADGVAALATSVLTVEAAFAVTDDVRALAPHGDEELHEHIATQLAAAGCAGRRVVVVVVDVPDARVRPAASTGGGALPGRVVVDGDVTLRDVACFLVGDEGEQVSDDADLELSWYDASEIDAVRALL